MLELAKYSFGVGDRFGHQAKAQLRACQMIAEDGVAVTPVWNKSYREHTTIGSPPSSVRAAADLAVRELGWTGGYHVDADHIRVNTVGEFLSSSDFYTIDVADSIGKRADRDATARFVKRHGNLVGRLSVPGVAAPFEITGSYLEQTADQYIAAVQEAGAIYRKIRDSLGDNEFITEVSMDETDSPQTPAELLVILAAMADEGIPLQTIAPKFTGRFNKGVDYVGDISQFRREFSDDIAVLEYAAQEFGLPPNLKLSVHSGSDKFSLYEPIRDALARFDAGLHIKTAGTTWLEEIIGLAESGGDGLALAREIYAKAFAKRDALCAPYAAVIDIKPDRLPTVSAVNSWTGDQFAAAVRHEPRSPHFNPDMRQLLHVGYKVAAEIGDRFYAMLDSCEPTIARNVTLNLYERHLKPLFLPKRTKEHS